MKTLLILALAGTSLLAQDPGAHRISPDQAQTMLNAWKGAKAKPGNLRGTFIWDRAVILKLLATPGATKFRYHLAVNANGDATLVPAVLDAKDTILAWIGLDAATGAVLSADQALSAHQAWKGAKWKPTNAPNTITYPVQAFSWLLNLAGSTKLQTDLALDLEGNLTVVSTSLDASGTPVTESGTTAYVDAGDLCPPMC